MSKGARRYAMPVPEEQDKLFEKPAGPPRPYDEKLHTAPIMAVKRGVSIIFNELGRLRDASQERGLSAAEAMTLKAYVQTCSQVAKDHKSLNMAMTDEEFNYASDEKLVAMVADHIHSMDPKYWGPEALSFMKRPRKKKEVIEYDGN